MPVDIAGAPGFDVSHIDPSSLRVEGLTPLTAFDADVTSPAHNPWPFGWLPCAGGWPDGIDDRVLKVRARDLAGALEQRLGRPLERWDVVPVRVEGRLRPELGANELRRADEVVILGGWGWP